MKIALVSLGCPKNLVDSEKMLAELGEGGCVVGVPMDEADAVVVNTCGFLSAARDESLGIIREALALKRSGRVRRVIVAGCLVNRDARKLYDLAPGIDAVVGVNNRQDILSAVTGRGRMTRISPYSPRGGEFSDQGRFRLTPRHTAYLRIAEGCSQRCTFCTIPAIRGPFRSKDPQQVLREAQELIDDGAAELNVIAQDTTSYGRDLRPSDEGPISLAGLLRSLDRLEAARWVRLMYAYPRRFSDELIAAIAECPRVVKYVDIPLQHINDTILRRMGRGVGRAATEKLLDKIRARIPGVAIRTAFIVGFPGETRGQFEELLEFVKAFRFDALGVFEFSPEEGAPAGDLGKAVAPEVRAERAGAIMLAQQKIAFAAGRRRIGDTMELLVDGMDDLGRCVARHAGQAPDVDSICLLTKRRPGGKFISARVVDAKDYDLIVEPE